MCRQCGFSCSIKYARVGLFPKILSNGWEERISASSCMWKLLVPHLCFCPVCLPSSHSPDRSLSGLRGLSCVNIRNRICCQSLPVHPVKATGAATWHFTHRSVVFCCTTIHQHLAPVDSTRYALRQHLLCIAVCSLCNADRDDVQSNLMMAEFQLDASMFHK